VVYFGTQLSTTINRELHRTFRLGFMGALGWDSNKGLDIALEAFRNASARLDVRYRFVIAGDGRQEPWRDAVGRLGLTSRVDFVGFVHQPAEFLASLDVLLSPVRYEAYGLAVQEALVQGTPALVSADAGVSERMASVPEFLVHEKESPHVWADRVVGLVEHLDAARASATRAGQQLAGRSWSEMAEEIVAAAETEATQALP
jgi:glycosyltransferase involved in cell wall biosynthesis